MPEPRILLLVEDNPGDVNLITEMLQAADRERHFQVEVARTLADGIERVATCDVVLLDLSLPDSHGLKTFIDFRDAALRRNAWRPVIVVTGLADEDIGRQAIRQGAQDFLFKGRFDGSTLLRSILYSVERHRRQEAEAGLATIAKALSDMRGEVAALRTEVAETTAAVAETAAAVTKLNPCEFAHGD